MASSVVLRRHISDITKCSICLDVFDTPTSLPCLHTFCLRCLQRIFAVDQPGDVVNCPICRREFQLPAAGLAALPRNFTIDGLVEMYTVTRPASSPGSLHKVLTATVSNKSFSFLTDDETKNDPDMLNKNENGVPTAEATTGDTTGSRSLSTTANENDQQSLTEVFTTWTIICDMHTDAEFCFDCREDVCMTCCGDTHHHHRRRRLTDVRAECHRRVADELARVTDALNATHLSLLNVDQRRFHILEQLHRQEGFVRKECCSWDDSDVEERLRALSAEKDDALRQLAARRELLHLDQMSLETFLKEGPQKLMTATDTAGLLRVVKEVKMQGKFLLSVHQTRFDNSEVEVDEKQQTLCTGTVRQLHLTHSRDLITVDTIVFACRLLTWLHLNGNNKPFMKFASM